LDSQISRSRREREGSFTKQERKRAEYPGIGRILDLAASGELGIAKNVVLGQISFRPNNQELIRTMAILETFEEGGLESPIWRRILLQRFPKDDIGINLKKLQSSLDERKWGNVVDCCEEILKLHEKIPIAISSAAKAYSSLGNHEVASDFWFRLISMAKLSDGERYEAARSFYNAKRYSEAASTSLSEPQFEGLSERNLELAVRSYYNIEENQKCIEVANELLQVCPDHASGLRYKYRSLVRMGRLLEAIQEMEKYCGANPFSASGWESLIETHLRMDMGEKTIQIWEGLYKLANDSESGFFTTLEIALRFHRMDVYSRLVNERRATYSSQEEFFVKIAQIHLQLGNIGESWKIILENGMDPMQTRLSEQFREVMTLTGTTSEDLSGTIGGQRSVWISQLVTREIIRRRPKQKQIRKGRKICHLITSSLDRGGAERQVVLTLKHMSGNKEYDCTLAAHRVRNRQGGRTYLEELGNLAENVIDLGSIEIGAPDDPGRATIDRNADILNLLDGVSKRKVELLISHFSRFEPDLVHAWQDETIFTSSIAGALTGVPIIMGSARSLSPNEKTELHIRKRPYLGSCFREIFQNESFFLSTNSTAGRKSYSKWIGIREEEIEVIHNGVDFEKMEKDSDEVNVRKRMKEFGFEETDVIVGGVFRLEAGKRPGLWIDSFSKAREKMKSIKGVIVGGGKMKDSLIKSVEESSLDDVLKIVGEVEDVAGWLSNFDIFLFTSMTEGLPNVLIEAQAFGVPVISTAVGGVPEVVTDGKTGILVNSPSSGEIADSIVQMISSGSIKQAAIESKKAKSRFSIDMMIRRTCEMYSRVLSLRVDETGR
jgi:glycosyltransferase involved in cell wall biosynthesis/tetratricopeptide (TPR) repeat protein